MEKMNIFLKAHTIFLTPTVIEDLDDSNWHHWYNDYQVTQFNSHGVFPISPEEEREIVASNLRRKDMILFTVRTVGESKIIGNACLNLVNVLHRNADLGLTIGHPDYLGRTAGLEAIGLLVKHGFERLNLHRIYGSAPSGLTNWLRMLRVYGFEAEGVWKESFLRDGKFHDITFIATFQDRYFAMKKERGGEIICENLNKLLKATVGLK